MAAALAQLARSEARNRSALERSDFAESFRGSDRPIAAVPRRLSSIATVRSEPMAGFEVIRIRPIAAPPRGRLLYLHGGAHVFELGMSVWKVLAAMVSRTGAEVTVPVYGLAPEHTIDDAIPFLDAVYETVAGAEQTGRFAIMGDSSGAGLAVGLAIRVRDDGRVPADALLLSSPWVDARMGNPEIRAIEARDPMLRSAGLVSAARAWAAGRSLADPQLSPITDPLTGLPPMSIAQGTHDVFYPDVLRFADKARAAGNPVRLTVATGGFHNYIAATFLPEAAEALDRFAAAVGESGHPSAE